MKNFISDAFIRDYKSPNYNDRPQGMEIDTVVLHYTEMNSVEESIKLLCDKTAKVSAHYVLDYDGSIYQLVDDKHRAWHAGVSTLKYTDAERKGVNDFSIGIEIQNKGLPEEGQTKPEPYTEAQYQSLINLLGHLVSVHPIKFIVGHSCIAPERKIDPGEHFDWGVLRNAGFMKGRQ